MLELNELTGGWGPTIVIEDLSLAIGRGETVAVVGRNGVGKSTLLELIAGRATRGSGTIRLDGEEIAAWVPHQRSHHGLAYVPQHREVFKSLTVDEHVAIAARPGRWNRDAVFDLFPGLAKRAGSLGGTLSGGEQQMLSIARALLSNPKVILMDEPSEGLAPLIVEFLVGAIKQITSDRSVAVLLVEQRIDIALDISSRCIVMERGKIVREGASADMSELDMGSLMGLNP